MLRFFSFGVLVGSLPFLAAGSSTLANEKKLPAIDQAAPAKIETATFGLG